MAARAPFRAALRARLPFLATRVVRAGVLAAALAVAACGDDDDSTGPGDADGTYALVRVEGEDVPVTGNIQGTAVTLRGGSMELDGGAYVLTIDLRANNQNVPATDEGTVERDGDDLAFSSTSFGDQFQGQLSDNNGTLVIDYDLTGDGTTTSFEFERR